MLVLSVHRQILVQVLVSQQEKKNRYFHLTGSLKKIGKYVGRGNKRSIAAAVVQNVVLRREVVVCLCREMQREIRNICSDTHDSILRMTSKPALENFTWDRVWQELLAKSPLLAATLTGLLPASKKMHSNVIPALCVCASIILKLQNQKVNVVQTMISLVLKAGHATKQVCWHETT